MLVNNVQLPDLDVGDADTMEKYENELNAVTAKMSAIKADNKTQSQVIREQCHIIFEFFNNIFGAGTDRLIFGDKTNIVICLDAYAAMIKAVSKDKSTLADKLTNKFERPQNRQQRRQNQQNSKKKQHYNKPKLVRNE